MEKRKWWMEAVGYEIYIKSFYDSNNDGIGDLRGVFEKLDYLKDLGVTLIWLTPFYDSPMDDNGYDVRDFYDVASQFGTMEDIKAVIQKAHKLGIKVIMDLVLNHTSDEHQWFLESRKSKDNKYRNYYIWRPGRTSKDGKEVEPTNWASFFGGSCWKKDDITGEYYMKIFSDKMPDLNWEEKGVREGIKDVARFWLDLGIDGFRIDAAAHLSRAPFKDSNLYDAKYVADWSKFSNLDKVHDYLEELNEDVFKKYDIVTVGEVGGGASPKSGINYAGFKEGQLDMVFNFDHNWCIKGKHEEHETDLIRLKEVFLKWQTAFKKKGWNPLYWLNHDQPRVMSQYGDIRYHKYSGKMLATALYLMRGTPFIYQGEEIGMTNYPFKKITDFNDVSTLNNIKHQMNENPDLTIEKAVKEARFSSRDNARTPMQWSTEQYGGFSKVKPWLKPNENYRHINVELQQKDSDSILNYYKKLFQIRTNSIYKEVLTYGSFDIIDFKNTKVYSYIRKLKKDKILVVNNFTDENTTFKLRFLKPKQVILHNYEDYQIVKKEIHLRPYEALVIVLN